MGDRTACSRGYVAWILVWTNQVVKSRTFRFGAGVPCTPARYPRYGRDRRYGTAGTESSKAVPAVRYAATLAATWAGVRTWSFTCRT